MSESSSHSVAMDGEHVPASRNQQIPHSGSINSQPETELSRRPALSIMTAELPNTMQAEITPLSTQAPTALLATIQQLFYHSNISGPRYARLLPLSFMESVSMDHRRQDQSTTIQRRLSYIRTPKTPRRGSFNPECLPTYDDVLQEAPPRYAEAVQEIVVVGDVVIDDRLVGSYWTFFLACCASLLVLPLIWVRYSLYRSANRASHYARSHAFLYGCLASFGLILFTVASSYGALGAMHITVSPPTHSSASFEWNQVARLDCVNNGATLATRVCDKWTRDTAYLWWNIILQLSHMWPLHQRDIGSGSDIFTRELASAQAWLGVMAWVSVLGSLCGYLCIGWALLSYRRVRAEAHRAILVAAVMSDQLAVQVV